MLYHLLYPLHVDYSFFNVFRYITFRTIYASITALLLCFVIGPWLIRELGSHQIGQTIRRDGPERHIAKEGTPTMGGLLIVLAVVIPTLLWANLTNSYVWIALFVTVGYGGVGFCDDYRKVIRKNSKGLSAKAKFASQILLAGAAATMIYMDVGIQDKVSIPFFKKLNPSLGILYIPFIILVIVGASNAVNLTDGLDGLAILPTVMVAGALGIFVYVTGHVKFAGYLQIPYLLGVGEVVVFCGAIVGAGLGFLWFNAYPAQVFMGDVGALALGAALGIVAVVVRQELVLLIMGGVFVVETVSVILQVASYKLTGRRIFRMAPLHHHFELKGWPEPRVIVRFWIITVILVLVGLATLKIR